MYERITDEDPYVVPMRIYPAPHYTMGGLWVDYELMTTVPGLYAIGEANFSDHGANRLGASALMQGLADGYFVLPYTIGNYLAPLLDTKPVPDRPPGVPGGRGRGAASAIDGYLADQGHPLGRPLPQGARPASCGTTAAWSARPRACEKALSEIPALLRGVPEGPAGAGRRRSRSTRRLERAGRVDDFFQLAS